MLPILIVPEHLCEPAQLRHIDASYLDPYATKPKKWVRPRRAGMRVRMRLAPVIEIRHKVPLGVYDNQSAPGSLQDCDQLLKVLLRRKMVSLGRREREEIGRVLQAARPVTVSACTLSGGAATWLLWAMSWRGVGTPRQLSSSPPLHTPTLILSWWASMPGPLCFGPAGTLFQALADCAAKALSVLGTGGGAHARGGLVFAGSTTCQNQVQAAAGGRERYLSERLIRSQRRFRWYRSVVIILINAYPEIYH